MKISGTTALVTGAKRGMGSEYVRQLLACGARAVYATVRDPQSLHSGDEVRTLALDVTDPAAVVAVARDAVDVTLLINNAGSSTNQRLVDGGLDQIRTEIETHYFGTRSMVRAFAPILGANGGGAILNPLLALSCLAFDGVGAYSAAKPAQCGLTNAIRLELAAQHVQVTGLLVGSVDTGMMAGWDVPKSGPADVVRQALDGVEAGALEVLADEDTVRPKSSLAADPRALYPNAVPSSWSPTESEGTCA